MNKQKSLNKQGSSPGWTKRNIRKIRFLGPTRTIEPSTSGGMKVFVGNRKQWYSSTGENRQWWLYRIQDFWGGKEIGWKKRLFRRRDGPRGSQEKNQKHIEEAGTQWSTRSTEKKEKKTSEVKEAEKKWTKTVRDGKHNVHGEQGARLGGYKVNWSHTMGAFSKAGSSATPEGNSNTWWLNVLWVVKRTGDCKHLDPHQGLIKWNQEPIAEYQQVLPSSVSRTVSKGNGWKS